MRDLAGARERFVEIGAAEDRRAADARRALRSRPETGVAPDFINRVDLFFRMARALQSATPPSGTGAGSGPGASGFRRRMMSPFGSRSGAS